MRPREPPTATATAATSRRLQYPDATGECLHHAVLSCSSSLAYLSDRAACVTPPLLLGPQAGFNGIHSICCAGPAACDDGGPPALCLPQCRSLVLDFRDRCAAARLLGLC
eukprot:SAG11_NODE_8492_length_1009_cov_1.520879_2_plen_110_part_00